MRKSALILAAGALALAGCGQVNVSSNDADTQEAINDVGDAASDLLNGAGNAAAYAGNELGEAADAAGNALDSLGEGNTGGGGNKAD